MQTTVKLMLSFFLFIYLNGNAQDRVGTHSKIPSKTSMQGRSELRKDKKVKRHEEKALNANKQNLETHTDKPFVKKGHHKAPKNKNKEKENMKKG